VSNIPNYVYLLWFSVEFINASMVFSCFALVLSLRISLSLTYVASVASAHRALVSVSREFFVPIMYREPINVSVDISYYRLLLCEMGVFSTSVDQWVMFRTHALPEPFRSNVLHATIFKEAFGQDLGLALHSFYVYVLLAHLVKHVGLCHLLLGVSLLLSPFPHGVHPWFVKASSDKSE